MKMFLWIGLTSLLFSALPAAALVKCEGLCVFAERATGRGDSRDLVSYANRESGARDSLSAQCSDICRTSTWRGCDLRNVSCSTLAQTFGVANKSGVTLWIAVAYWNASAWRTVGWWELANGQTTDLVTTYGSDSVKLLATTNTRGGGRDWVPRTLSVSELCVDGANRFDRDMNDFNCNGGSLRRVQFGEVKLNPSGRTLQTLVP